MKYYKSFLKQFTKTVLIVIFISFTISNSLAQYKTENIEEQQIYQALSEFSERQKSNLLLSPNSLLAETLLEAEDNSSLGGRVPLILIHGIHGTSDLTNSCRTNYFDNLATYLKKDTSFNTQYKIYRFYYISDRYSAYDISIALREKVEAITTLTDKQIVLLAHSMGGVVARHFMELSTRNGTDPRFKNKRIGEKVIKLITLGTPHHGSQLANGPARVRLTSSSGLGFLGAQAALLSLDTVYWGKINGCWSCVTDYQHPNRGTLLWNNFDGSWTGNPLYFNYEKNNDLPREHHYGHKIIAYYGRVSYTSDAMRVAKAIAISKLKKRLPAFFQTPNPCGNNDSRDDTLLAVLSLLMEGIKISNFSNNNNLHPQNDGMVAEESGKFADPPGNIAILNRIFCNKYNHRLMKDGNTSATCSDGKTLLNSIKSRLRSINSFSNEINTPANMIEPSYLSGPAENSFGYISYGGTSSNENERTITLANQGDNAAQITSLNINGGDANQFSIVNPPNLPFTVQAQSEVELRVRFSPTFTGEKAATLTVGNNSSNPTINVLLTGFGVPSNCQINFTPDNRYIPMTGGSGSFTIPNIGCPFEVSTEETWIHTTINGNTVNFSVDNNSTGAVRVGNINVSVYGQIYPFSISQGSTNMGCWISISEEVASIPINGGTGSFYVTTPDNCGWGMQSAASWITITNPGLRIGSGYVNYSVTPNSGVSIRYGTILVEGQDAIRTYAIAQSANVTPCSYTLSSEEQTFSQTSGSGSFTFNTAPNCQWQIMSQNSWVTINSSNNGIGSSTISYSVSNNQSTSSRSNGIIIQGGGGASVFTVNQNGLPPTMPNIVLPTNSATLGDTMINSPAYQSLVVRNTGNGYLSIGNVYRSSGSSEFEVLPYPEIIQAGETGTVTVKFLPTSVGMKNASFSISSNDPDEPLVNFSVSGNGVNQLTGGIDFVWANKFNIPNQNSIQYISSATIGSKIYVLGGGNSVYDPTVNTWSSIVPEPFAQYGAADVINGKIYEVGYDPFLAVTRVLIYDPVSNFWSIGATLPTLRLDVSVAALNGKLYVFGGRDNISANYQITSQVYEYTPSTNSWALKTNMPTARMNSSAVSVNGLIYVIGGFAGNNNLSNVEVYNPVSNSWSTREQMPSRRAGLRAVTLNGKIYAIGGNGFAYGGSSPRNDLVEEFDPAKADAPLPGIFNAWSIKNPLLNGHAYHATGVVNNKIYVIGGWNALGNAVYTVEEGVLGASPRVNIPVTNVDYGTVTLGNIGEKGIEIQNLGNALLTTNYSKTGSEDFVFYRNQSSVNGGSSGNIRVRFVPSSTGIKTATIRVTTNDPTRPFVDINLTATGIQSPPTQGNYWQQVNTIPITGGQFANQIKVKNGKMFITPGSSGVASLDIRNDRTGNLLASIPFISFPSSRPGFITLLGNRAFVTLSNLGTNGQVAIINTDTNSLVGYIPSGADPLGIDSNGTNLFVGNNVWWTNGDPATVKVLNPNTSTTIANINVGVSPRQVTYSSSRGLIYVANGGPGDADELSNTNTKKSLSVIDPVTNTVLSTIPLQYSPFGVVINDTKAYVSTNSTIEVIDLFSNLVVSSIPVPSYSQRMILSGDYLLLTNNSLGKVYVIKTDTNQIVDTLNIQNSEGIDVDPETGLVYVLDGTNNSVKVLQLISPGFTVTTNSSETSANSGGSRTFSVTVKSIDGWSGNVNLSCLGIPTGGNCQFLQNPINLNANGLVTTNVTVNVPNGTTAGFYDLKIVGNALTNLNRLQVNTEERTSSLSLIVPTCSTQLNSSNLSIGANGGQFQANVTSSGCSWNAYVNQNWLSITSGSTGVGADIIGLTVTANTGPARSAILTIGSESVTITQSSGCSFQLSLLSQNFPATGGNGTFDINTNSACNWNAVTSSNWITITNPTGSGNGTVQYSVALNNLANPRNGTIDINGSQLTINQLGATSNSASIGGRILYANGAGARRVWVKIQNNSTQQVYFARTNGDGYFTVENLMTGISYTITPSLRGNILTPASQTITLNSSVNSIVFTSNRNQ